jgi:ubiquinone/menaquinone biosynthesis C-methylase UbiE
MELNYQQSEIRNKIKEYWDDLDQDYDGFSGHGVNSEIEKELWRNEIARLLGHRQNLKILDIGTGTGFLALLLAGMGHRITAVDWSMTMMQKAKEKAKASSIPIRFEVQDAENLTFADGSFDAVVSRHVLWTLADPFRASKEWARVTKPNGLVIADIPRQGSNSGKQHYGEEIGRSLPFGDGADPDEIVTMFKEAGLDNLNLILMEKPGEQHRKTLIIYGERV